MFGGYVTLYILGYLTRLSYKHLPTVGSGGTTRTAGVYIFSCCGNRDRELALLGS